MGTGAVRDNTDVLYTTVPPETRHLFDFNLPDVERDNNFQLIAFPFPYEVNADIDGGKGTPRTKKNVSYGVKVVDFKQLSKNVSSARSTILIASATLAAAGIGALYWWTIVALIGSAVTAGIAAYQIYSASNSAKADMKEAYNLLK